MRSLGFLVAGLLAGCGPSSPEGGWGPPPPSPNEMLGGETAGLGAARTDPACGSELEAIAARLAQARAAHVGRVPDDLSPPEVATAAAPGKPGIRLVVRPGVVHLHTWTYGPKELGELAKTLEAERGIGDDMVGEGGRSLDYVDIWADRSVPASEVEALVAVIPKPLSARLVVMRTAGPTAPATTSPSWVQDVLRELPAADETKRTETLLVAFGRAGSSCQPLSDTLRNARDRSRSERLPFVLRVVSADVLECGCQDVELPALEALMRAAEDSVGEHSGYLPLALGATGREVNVPKEATTLDLAKALVEAKVVEQPGPVQVKHAK